MIKIKTRYKKNYFYKFLSVTPPILLLLFELGLPKKELLISTLIVALIYAMSPLKFSQSQLKKGSLFLLLIYPVLIFAVQLSRLRLGLQGVDFAIFTQSSSKIPNQPILSSSLIGTEWHSFLTHHFSPYLLFPTALNYIKIPSELCLLFMHSVCVYAILYIAYKTFAQVGYNKIESINLCILFLILPFPRTALFWEVRDEIFALPFMIYAFLSFIREQDKKAILVCLISCLFKETMFLYSATFGVMGLWKYFHQKDNQKTNQIKNGYRILLVFGITSFMLYSFIFPQFVFQNTFNASSRIGTIKELTSYDIISNKLTWLFSVVMPLLPFILFSKIHQRKIKFQFGKSIALILPALPFLCAVVITNFPEMYTKYTYYGVVPSLLLALAAICFFKLHSNETSPILIPICLIIASILGDRVRIPKEIRSGITANNPCHMLTDVIPLNSKVITGDYDAICFIYHSQVIKILEANKVAGQFDFDFIAQRKTNPWNSNPITISDKLISQSLPYFENTEWSVRHRKN